MSLVKIIIALIGFIFAAWLGGILAQDPGYILIQFLNINIETSVWFALLLIAAFSLVAFITYNMLYKICYGFKLAHSRFTFISEKRQIQLTKQAIQALCTEDTTKAEKYLIKASKGKYKLVYLLSAACAAKNDQAQYKHYINMAYKHAPQEHTLITLLDSFWAIERSAHQYALEKLEQLSEQQAKIPEVMALKCQCYLALNMWDALKNTLKLCHKHGALTLQKTRQYETLYYQHKLQHSPKEKLTSLWSSLPRYAKSEPTILYTYAQQLYSNKQGELANKLIEKSLCNKLNTPLLSLYITNHTSFNDQLIKILDTLNTNHPENADIQHAYAKIYMLKQDYHSALKYYDASLKQQETAPILLEQALVYRTLGRYHQEQGCYERLQTLLSKPM